MPAIGSFMPPAMPPPANAQTSPARTASRHVALLALPEAAVSTLAGIYDVMNARALIGPHDATTPAPFRAEIVGEAVGPLQLASGVPFPVQRSIDTIESTDIVI